MNVITSKDGSVLIDVTLAENRDAQVKDLMEIFNKHHISIAIRATSAGIEFTTPTQTQFLDENNMIRFTIK